MHPLISLAVASSQERGINMDFKIAHDTSEINAALAGLLKFASDQSEMMGVIGSFIESSTKARFDSSTSPEGTAWKPSRRAAAENGKTLLDKGHLRDSIHYQAASDHVVIGTNLIYAAIHQFGGIIKAKAGGKLKFKHSAGFAVLDQVMIPARPFFGISGTDETEIEHIMADFIRTAAHGN